LSQTSAGIEIISQQSNNGLADGEAAAGQNYENPLAGLNETIHFSTNVDLIKTGVGPGIGGQYKPFPRRNPQAICHFVLCCEPTA
jgi:hypothetical protein